MRLLLPDTDVSTLSLFELADFAITIRGTVGRRGAGLRRPSRHRRHEPLLGARLHDRLGDGGSSTARCSRDLHEQPRLTADQVVLAKKHAHALFCRRPLHFTSFRSVIDLKHPGPFSHDLELTVSSRAELEAAADLQEFARWAVDRDREDYLRRLDSDDVVIDEAPRTIEPDDAPGAVEQAGGAQR